MPATVTADANSSKCPSLAYATVDPADRDGVDDGTRLLTVTESGVRVSELDYMNHAR